LFEYNEVQFYLRHIGFSFGRLKKIEQNISWVNGVTLSTWI